MGAVHDNAVSQTDNAAAVSVHRQDRMEEQAGMGAVAAHPEALFLGWLRGKQHVGRVHDRQDVTSGGALVGLAAGGGQHFERTHRRVGQKATEADGLVPLLGQPVQAQGPFGLHRVKQDRARFGVFLMSEPSEGCLCHAILSCARSDAAIDSETGAIRNSFRGCTTTVA